MKKHYLKLSAKLFLFAVIAVVSAGSAFAQTGRVSKFTATFDFYVGNQKLPAGTYSVKSLNERVIMISGAEKIKSVVPVWMTTAKTSGAEGGEMIFNRYGDQYFLSQILSHKSAGRVLSESKTEKEVRGKSNNVARSGVEKVTIEAKGL